MIVRSSKDLRDIDGAASCRGHELKSKDCCADDERASKQFLALRSTTAELIRVK